MNMNEYNKNPNFIKAMEFIQTNDLSSLANGRYDIDGDNLYLMIIDAELRLKENAKLEVHDKYIDIQIPLSCAESYGTKHRNLCSNPIGNMDKDKDILFYDDQFENLVSSNPGEIIVFPPEIAHAPLIGNGLIHKAIFKVKV